MLGTLVTPPACAALCTYQTPEQCLDLLLVDVQASVLLCLVLC
jgi:hypothetical protein